MEEATSLWVFGYGSLVWKPGFEHGQTSVGYVEGYARRFWQGNETHRGTPGQPGRVATLVEEGGTCTHGMALELKGEDALEYLNNREMTLGGYLQRITTFHTMDGSRPPFPVLVFVATPQSKHWLGPAPLETIAKQVVNSSGPSGHNVEYVLRLAHWLRTRLPTVWDEHLYGIETHILVEVQLQQLCLEALMGKEAGPAYYSAALEGDDHMAAAAADDGRPAGAALLAAPASPTTAARMSSYSATCHKKCLRCVKL